jgi:hypothetical protein
VERGARSKVRRELRAHSGAPNGTHGPLMCGELGSMRPLKVAGGQPTIRAHGNDLFTGVTGGGAAALVRDAARGLLINHTLGSDGCVSVIESAPWCRRAWTCSSSRVR